MRAKESEAQLDHPLLEVAQAFPHGIPGLQSPFIEALDDEQALSMAQAMSEDSYTPLEMQEVAELVEYCKNRDPKLLPTLLRQFFSGLQYKRYLNLLLVTDDRRLKEEREEDPAGAAAALIRRRVDHCLHINAVAVSQGFVNRRKIEARMTWDAEQHDRRISRLSHEFRILVNELSIPDPEKEAKLQAWVAQQERVTAAVEPPKVLEAPVLAEPTPEGIMAFFKNLMRRFSL